MRPMWYREVDGKPVPATLLEAAPSLEEIGKRRVAETWIGKTSVSTVFLALDHQYLEGPPLLYETMTFSPIEELDEWQERYPARETALAGHERIVAEIQQRMEEEQSGL